MNKFLVILSLSLLIGQFSQVVDNDRSVLQIGSQSVSVGRSTKYCSDILISEVSSSVISAGTSSGGYSDTFTDNEINHTLFDTGVGDIEVTYTLVTNLLMEDFYLSYDFELNTSACSYNFFKIRLKNQTSGSFTDFLTYSDCGIKKGSNAFSTDFVKADGGVEVKFSLDAQAADTELFIDQLVIKASVRNCGIVNKEVNNYNIVFSNTCSISKVGDITVITGLRDCFFEVFNLTRNNLRNTPCSPNNYLISPEAGSYFSCCDQPTDCSINAECVNSGEVRYSYCCYQKSKADYCPGEGTVTWNQADLTSSVCYADNRDDLEANDCEKANGCVTDLVLSSSPESLRPEFITCSQDADSVFGCSDGVCDEDDDELYCCLNDSCVYSGCDKDLNWVFDKYSLTITDGINESVFRSSCAWPSNTFLNTSLTDTKTVIDGNLVLTSPSGTCTRTGTYPDYYCDYNPLDTITANNYEWNVSYHRGNSSLNASTKAFINLTGCLRPIKKFPITQENISRSDCNVTYSSILSLDVKDENNNFVTGVNNIFDLGSQNEVCVFTDFLNGTYTCNYDPSDSLRVGAYVYNYTTSKPYFLMNYTDNDVLNIYGCQFVLLYNPVNGSFFDSENPIFFNNSIKLDNDTILQNSFVNISINKMDNEFIVLNSSHSLNGFNTITYQIPFTETFFGVWNINYTPNPRPYFIDFPNYSYVNTDNITVIITPIGPNTQSFVVSGVLTYMTGKSLDCIGCVTVNVNDSKGIVTSYNVDVVNNIFSQSITRKLTGGVNKLWANVTDGDGINGSSAVTDLVLDATLSVTSLDPNFCLDRGSNQALDYNVTVNNVGNVKFSNADIFLAIYDDNNNFISDINLGAFVLENGMSIKKTISQSLGLSGVGDYGAYVRVVDYEVSNGLDVIGSYNSSPGYANLKQFKYWEIVDDISQPISGTVFDANQLISFNATANVQTTPVSKTSLTNKCNIPCVNISINSPGGVSLFSGGMSVSGVVFEKDYLYSECGTANYVINYSENVDCGLFKQVTVPFSSKCLIFIESFNVQTSKTNVLVQDKSGMVVREEDVTFEVVVRDLIDIDNIDLFKVNIVDEFGRDVGAWEYNVGNIDDPLQSSYWERIDNSTAVWKKPWKGVDLKCGKYGVNLFVNNFAGENDSKSLSFILDDFSPNMVYDTNIIVGSGFSIVGDINSCAQSDGSSFLVNYSDVDVDFYYFNKGTNIVNSKPSGSGAFSLLTQGIDDSDAFINSYVKVSSSTHSGCDNNCGYEQDFNVSSQIFKTSLNLTPRELIIGSGVVVENAFEIIIVNPSNQDMTYTLTLSTDKSGAPIAFSDVFSQVTTVTVPKQTTIVKTLDIIPTVSGIYAKRVELRNNDFVADNSSVGFKLTVNLRLNNFVFSYYVVDGFSTLSVFLVLMIGSLLFFKKLQ